MIKLFLEILKDQRGLLPLLLGLGAGALGAGGLMSAFGGQDEDIYDPYAAGRAKYSSYLSSKLGQQTPYKYNDAFTLTQPDTEKAAEQTVLGYLKNPTSNVSDYGAATKKYSDATKAVMEETYAKERKDAGDMYNRLGLVSSTPGLTAQTDINAKQRTESNFLDADLMYKNLDRTLQAQGLDVSQLNSMLGQAGNISAAQRGAQEYSQGMSMQDIIRMIEEEQNWAKLQGGFLGQNPAERTLTPDWLSQLGGTFTNLGSMGLMAGLLGGGAKAAPKLTTTV